MGGSTGKNGELEHGKGTAREIKRTSSEYDRWDFGTESQPTLMLARFKALPVSQTLPPRLRHSLDDVKSPVSDAIVESQIERPRKMQFLCANSFRCCSVSKATPTQAAIVANATS